MAAGLGLAALLLYLSTPIHRIFGDGSTLILLHSASDLGQAVYIHALYLPLARALGQVLALVGLVRSPAETLLLLSQLSGALAISMSFLVLRGFSIERTAAAVTCMLVAVSPPVWFFADTIEVHAPHFAAVTTLAALTLFGPWRRPVLATLLVAAGLPALFLTHQSGLLLFPGWVLLVQVGRRRVAPAFSARTLVLGIAPAFVAALGAALWCNASLRGISLGESLHATTTQVDAHLHFQLWRSVWRGWLQPLALIWVPVVIGAVHLARAPRTHGTRAALLSLLLPSLSFFLVWGVSERGAYTLGSLVFLAVLAGLGVESVIRAQGSGEPAGSSTRESAATRAAGRSTWVLVAMVGCLLLQARTALNEGLAFDTPAAHQAQTERARAAEAAFARPDRPHVLISFDPRGQTVTALAPSILEYRLKGTLLRSLETGRTPAAFADLVLALLRAPRPGPRPEVLLDRGYEPYLAEFAAFEPHIRAMEVALREAFEVEALPGPGGGFWRLEPHGTAPRLAQH